MKNNSFIKSILLVSLATMAISSCKQDIRSLDISFTPVTNLITPSDQTDIQLNAQSDSNIVFQWTPATTPDSGLILYQVAFDSVGGNFNKPIYKVLSDGSGVMTQATISQKLLNQIASLAGIQASSTGKVIWTVIASKAANAKVTSMNRTLILERPAGFAILPDSMFLTGTATEAGDDITKAIPMKKTADGVFELYTSLKAGTYQLSDKANGNGTRYYIDTTDNIIKEGNSLTTFTGATKAYRLTYDFTVATAQKTEIKSIGLYQSAKNEEIGQLAYIGNSTWAIDSLPVVFVQFSWGRDDRYKFILHTSKGIEWWGSQNYNNVPPAGQPASYFYLVPVTNTQWDYTFKFDPAADGHEVDVDMYFQATAPYTHKITYLN